MQQLRQWDMRYTMLLKSKKFDEGASVGELIQTVVNFYGAFYKLLDLLRTLFDVLEFFGFEDLANTFRDLVLKNS